MLIYKWRGQGQDIIFLCPISSPFAILHVDIWMQYLFTDSNSNVALTNVIYDMTQFIIVFNLSIKYHQLLPNTS